MKSLTQKQKKIIIGSVLSLVFIGLVVAIAVVLSKNTNAKQTNTSNSSKTNTNPSTTSSTTTTTKEIPTQPPTTTTKEIPTQPSTTTTKEITTTKQTTIPTTTLPYSNSNNLIKIGKIISNKFNTNYYEIKTINPISGKLLFPKSIYSDQYNYEPIINVILKDSQNNTYYATCKIIGIVFDYTKNASPRRPILLINIKTLNYEEYTLPNKIYQISPNELININKSIITYSGFSLQELLNDPRVNSNSYTTIVYDRTLFKLQPSGLSITLDKPIYDKIIAELN